MANIRPGSAVRLLGEYEQKLAFAPPDGCDLRISVHPGALKAGGDTCTHVVAMKDGQVSWAGAVDERMLQVVDRGPGGNPREELGLHLLRGTRLWAIVRPGSLVLQQADRPLFCVYDGDRPWVVIGELANGVTLAAPLNDEVQNVKWWMPALKASEKEMPNSLDSYVELAHIWSLSRAPHEGVVRDEAARARIEESLRAYFPIPGQQG